MKITASRSLGKLQFTLLNYFLNQPVTSDSSNVLITRVPCYSIDPAFVVFKDPDLLVLDSVEDDGSVVC